MEDEGPILGRALASASGRQLLLAIEAELCALVEAARHRSALRATGEGEEGLPGCLAVVLAEGLGGYARMLVHKTVERFEGLRSFSIGVGLERRTLVLAKPDSSSPFLRFEDFPFDNNSRSTVHGDDAPNQSERRTRPNDRSEPVETSGSAPAGTYVPPSRRSEQGKRERPQANVYVPPARRRGDRTTQTEVPPISFLKINRPHDNPQQSQTTDESPLTVTSSEDRDSAEPKEKRRKGRGFQQEARKPFDETFTLLRDSSHPADHLKDEEGKASNKADDVDEELAEILYTNDAELKPLENAEGFRQWHQRYGPSPSSGVQDHWASLDQSRRRRLQREKRKERSLSDIEVVNPYPEHVLELYDISPSVPDHELQGLLVPAGGARLLRIKESTAIAAFTSPAKAKESLSQLAAAPFKLRTLAEASRPSLTTRGVALELDTNDLPSRPPANARVAQRMLSHALGLSPSRKSDD